MRVYVNSGGTINPLVTFTLHEGQWSNQCPIYSRIKNFWYTMNRGMGRHQSLSAWFGEHRNLLRLPRSKQPTASSLYWLCQWKLGEGEREQERERKREREIEIKRKKETQNTAGGLSFMTITHLWGQSTAQTDPAELGLFDLNFSLLLYSALISFISTVAP